MQSNTTMSIKMF